MNYTITLPYVESIFNDYEKFASINATFTMNGEPLKYSKGDSFLSKIVFHDKSDRRVFFCDDPDEVIEVNIQITIDENENINFTCIEDDKIFKTKLRDFEQGTYLAICFNKETFKLSQEILVSHPNITTLGGCFASEVEKKKFVLAYVKLNNIDQDE